MLGTSCYIRITSNEENLENREVIEATVIRVTSKGKVDLRLLDGTIYKGWHSDRIKPFVLRQDRYATCCSYVILCPACYRLIF